MAAECRRLPDFGRERPIACCGQAEEGCLEKTTRHLGRARAARLWNGRNRRGADHLCGPGYAGPGLSDPALPPYEIMSIVRSTGLAPLTRPMRRGPYYVLVAVDRVGRQMRVVVDAQLGDIVNLRPALAAGSYGPELGRPVGPPEWRRLRPTSPGRIPRMGRVRAANSMARIRAQRRIRAPKVRCRRRRRAPFPMPGPRPRRRQSRRRPA